MLSWGRCTLAHTELGWTGFHVLLYDLGNDAPCGHVTVPIIGMLTQPVFEFLISLE